MRALVQRVSRAAVRVGNRWAGLDVHAGITAVDGYAFRNAGLGLSFYE